MITVSFISLLSGSHHWKTSGSAQFVTRSYYCGPIHENSGYDSIDHQFVGPYILTTVMPAGINFRSPLIVYQRSNASTFYSDDFIGVDPYQIVPNINNARTDVFETYNDVSSFISIGVSSSVDFQSSLYTFNLP